jgi:hypothetical protein
MRWGPVPCLPTPQAGHDAVIDAKACANSKGGTKAQVWAVAQSCPALQL